MILFDIGDKVAILIWNRETQKFDYEPGTVKKHHDISHYVIQFDSDKELYLCHTSKVVSAAVIEKVEIIQEDHNSNEE